MIYAYARQRDFQSRPILPNGRLYWEFFWLWEGEVSMTVQRQVQGEARIIEKSVPAPCVWITPPQLQHGKVGGVSRYHNVMSDRVPALLESWVGAEGGLLACPIPEEQREAMHASCDAMVACGEGPLEAFRLEVIFQQLNLTLLERVPETFLKSAKQGKDDLLQLLNLYEEQLSDCPTVSDLAVWMHCSERQLHRRFMDQMSCSPKRAMAARQMEVACRLLRDTGMNLEDITMACGFNNRSSFSRKFREAFGLSPMAWRASRHKNS